MATASSPRASAPSASRRAACVLAAGGFESNREWLREAWGQNEDGEWPADNFLIRGTRFNRGVLLKFMIDAGADSIGDPSQSHCVAIDARAPLYDGGICTRVDCVSLGVWSIAMPSASTTRARISGPSATRSGAVWSRSSPARSAIRSSMPRRSAASCRRCFRARRPTRCSSSRDNSASTKRTFVETIETYNAACRVGTFDHAVLDDCHTEGLTPAKTHWARPIDTPPFYAYALRPGITFTYLGLKVNEHAAVHFGGKPSPNLFVAGEMMAGNVLGKGYTAASAWRSARRSVGSRGSRSRGRA